VSVKLSAEEVTHRTHRIAKWSGFGLLCSLLMHAVLLPDGEPTGVFNVHLGVTVFVGLVAAIGWCTQHLLRAQRKSREKLVVELRRIERKILTTSSARQMMQDAFDEGQITGLATGLADLSRAPRPRPSEN